MPKISMDHPHALGPDDARERVLALEADLQERYGLETRWEGLVLHVKRSGIDGTLSIEASRIAVRLKVSMMLGVLRGPIESGVRQELERLFPPS